VYSFFRLRSFFERPSYAYVGFFVFFFFNIYRDATAPAPFGIINVRAPLRASETKTFCKTLPLTNGRCYFADKHEKSHITYTHEEVIPPPPAEFCWRARRDRICIAANARDSPQTTNDDDDDDDDDDDRDDGAVVTFVRWSGIVSRSFFSRRGEDRRGCACVLCVIRIIRRRRE